MSTKRYLYRASRGQTSFSMSNYATDIQSGMEVYEVGEPLTDAATARIRLEGELESAQSDESRAAQRRESLENQLRLMRLKAEG